MWLGYSGMRTWVPEYTFGVSLYSLKIPREYDSVLAQPSGRNQGVFDISVQRPDPRVSR